MVSSVLNKFQGIQFDDINWEKNYDKWSAYGQSKAANILFALELNKLYKARGIQAFALNPGAIMTNLQSVLSLEEQKSTGDCAITNVVNDNISQFVDRTTHAAEQLWILSEKMTREKSN